MPMSEYDNMPMGCAVFADVILASALLAYYHIVILTILLHWHIVVLAY